MTPVQLLARDVGAARKRLHLTVAVMASQIGISESALRRIENGTSKNTHGVTAFAILAWAGARGYRHFAGFRITPKPSPFVDTPRTVARTAAQRRVIEGRQGGLFG